MHIDRALRGLLIIRLLGALADGAMLPFIVVWARRYAGLTGAEAGLLFLAQALGEMLGGVVGGSLADRVGHRRVLVVAATGMAVGYGSLAVIRLPVLAVTALFVAGLFESAFHPTVFALVGDIVEDSALHRSFSLLNVYASVGRIAGPLIGAAVVLIELPMTFAAAAGLLVFAVVITLLMVPNDRVPAPEEPESGGPETPAGVWLSIVRDRRLGTLVAAGGVLSITVTWLEADGLVIVRSQRPLGTTSYAALFALAAAVTVILQLPASRWARSRAPGRVMLAGGCVQGAGLGLLALAGSGFGILVIGVIVLAAGQMLYGPAVSTFITQRAGRDRRATYQAALSTTEDIGTAIGPSTGLALAGLGSGTLVWLVAAPLCALAAAAGARAVAPSADRPSAGHPGRAPLSARR